MKKGLKGLLILFIAALVALVIALNLTLDQDGVRNELSGNGNFQNLSTAKGNVVLNVTLTGNATFSMNWTNVTFMFSNTTSLYLYNTTIRNSTQNATYFANNSFNTALLADGVYALSINYTNVSSDNGQNLSSPNTTITNGGYNITIDTTPPSFNLTNMSGTPLFGTALGIVNGSNFSASRGNISINFTVDDPRPASANNGLYSQNLFNISEVRFVFDNGTGADFNLSSYYNSTGLNNGTSQVQNRSGVWTLNYNLSSLSEGTQGVTVYVNDTFNNTRVVIFNFTVDRSAPTLTLASSSVDTTSAKITGTTNESVDNCTYVSLVGSLGSGNFSVVTAGTLTSYSKTFSSLTASTSYQVEVTCTDFVGYQTTAATSWSTSAAAAASSNGGGGSGGSSGGISAGVQGQTAKEVWTSINAGETAKVEVENGAIGVTEVSFTVPTLVYGAWVQVAKKDSLPSSVSSFEGKVYRNLEISKGPALNKEGAFTDATVQFKVEKAWLAEKQLMKEAVALHHYENGVWTQLATTVGEDDGTYVHYSAKTPGFSYFVIGEKTGAAAAEVPAEEPVVEVPTEEPVVEAPVGEPAMAENGLSKTWVVALLAALVVVVAVVVYLRKRR